MIASLAIAASRVFTGAPCVCQLGKFGRTLGSREINLRNIERREEPKTALGRKKMQLNFLSTRGTEANATAVATAQTQPLQVYPNPVVSGQLIINNEQLRAGDRIEIYSLSEALEKTFVATGTKSAIDLSTLSTGTYVVKAKNAAAKVVTL
jgi:hypothetical protein